ncbi:MAG: hypothetical protein IJ568_01690 [Bacilli bacterium]|nr:hypothetical protein [Bacilli bacterium]
METLENKDLKRINGGGLSFLAALGIVAGVTFVVGAIDGFVRPQKCN